MDESRALVELSKRGERGRCQSFDDARVEVGWKTRSPRRRHFALCANKYGLALGDFPDVDDFRAGLLEIADIRRFPKLDKGLVADMDRMFAADIPRLLDRAVRARPG